MCKFSHDHFCITEKKKNFKYLHYLEKKTTKKLYNSQELNVKFNIFVYYFTIKINKIGKNKIAIFTSDCAQINAMRLKCTFVQNNSKQNNEKRKKNYNLPQQVT